MAKHETSDYEINGAVRRELASLGVDLSEVRYRCSGGAVEVQGKLKFREPKPITEIIKVITLLEEQLAKIRGVKRVKMDFEDWDRSGGTWGRALTDDTKPDQPS